jgi:N-acetylglucosamine kinase-like BadF-type ATPase
VLLGLAGVDTPEDAEEAQREFAAVFETYKAATVEVVGDVEIALASGSTADDAICLIAGTGSNCWGYNRAGQRAKASGMGQLLTDQGSGYELGMAALKMATKSFDGRIEHSLLQELVLQHFEVASFAELNNKIYEPFLTKPQIAELAHEVETAAQAHDHAAQTIIAQAVAEWLEMVKAVVAKLNLSATATDLVLVGGLTNLAVLYKPFAVDLKDHYPQLKIIKPEKPPVYGALALALKELHSV